MLPNRITDEVLDIVILCVPSVNLIVFVLMKLPFTIKLPAITKFPTLSSVINEDPVPAVF